MSVPDPMTSPAAAFAEQAALEHRVLLALRRGARRFLARTLALAEVDGAHTSPATLDSIWAEELETALAGLRLPETAAPFVTAEDVATYVRDEPSIAAFSTDTYETLTEVFANAAAEAWESGEVRRTLTIALSLDEHPPEGANAPEPRTGQPVALTAAIGRRRVPLGFRLGQAARTATTGLHGAVQAARFVASAVANEPGRAPSRPRKSFKKWVTRRDNKVRDAHAAADAQVVPTEEPFTVGDLPMERPGDRSAPPELVFNCRCVMVYTSDPFDGDFRGKRSPNRAG